MSSIPATAPSIDKKPAKASPLQGSYAAWARLIAEKEKLRVVFGGRPATNGKTMWIPSLPYDLSEEDLFLVRSDIMHESGHCVDSDFVYFTEFGTKHGRFAQSLLNSIEDVRIEVRRSIPYPGATRLIRDSNILMMKKGCSRTGERDAADALSTLAYMQGCVLRGWHDEHEDVLNKAYSYLVQHLGQAAEEAIKKAVQVLKDGYPTLKSTQDAGELTLAVMKVFSDAQEQLSQDSGESSEDERQEESEQSEGESSDQGSGEDDNDSSDPESGEGSSEESNGDDEDQDTDGSGSNSKSEDSGSDESSDDDQGKDGQSGTDTSDQDSGSDEGDSGDGEGESDPGSTSNQTNDDGQPQSGDSGTEGETEGNATNQESTPGNSNPNSESEANPNSESGQPTDGKATAKNIAEMLDSNPGDEEVIDYRKMVEELANQIANGSKPEYDDKPLVPEHAVDFRKEEDRSKGNDAKDVAGNSAGDMSVEGCEWAPKNRERYRELDSGISRSSGVLLGRLQMLLRSATKVKTKVSNKGKMNARKLFRVKLDDDRVFKKTNVKHLPKAAVTVLTDISSSMECTYGQPDSKAEAVVPLTLALQAQILLQKAMETIGNPTEFAGFGGSNRATMTFTKTFDQNALEARDRVGGMESCAGGGTPLLKALMHASMRLGARKERKKVMFIITDGVPAVPAQCGDLIGRIRESGIVVINILIGMDGTPNYLLDHPTINIDDVQELPTKLLELLKDEVLGG